MPCDVILSDSSYGHGRPAVHTKMAEAWMDVYHPENGIMGFDTASSQITYYYYTHIHIYCIYIYNTLCVHTHIYIYMMYIYIYVYIYDICIWCIYA